MTPPASTAAPADAPAVVPAADPATAADFASVELPDLVGLVEAQLTRAIVEGRLPPGSRIVEADIARRMGVSRAPVREPARRRESQGVLVAKPRHGFAVRAISVQEIDDLYEVRIGLELTSIELACRKADDARQIRLRGLVSGRVLQRLAQSVWGRRWAAATSCGGPDAFCQPHQAQVAAGRAEQ